MDDSKFTVLAKRTTPLSAGGEYATPAAFSTSYSYLRGTVKADQDGLIYSETSDDGTAWTGELTWDYAANDKLTFKIPVTGIYSRLRFVNGSTDQGSFFMVVYGTTGK